MLCNLHNKQTNKQTQREKEGKLIIRNHTEQNKQHESPKKQAIRNTTIDTRLVREKQNNWWKQKCCCFSWLQILDRQIDRWMDNNPKKKTREKENFV